MYKILDADEVKSEIAEYEKLDRSIPIFDNAEYIVLEEEGRKTGYAVITDKGKKYILERIFINSIFFSKSSNFLSLFSS